MNLLSKVHGLFWDHLRMLSRGRSLFKLVSGAVEAGYGAETITVEVGFIGLPNTNGMNHTCPLPVLHILSPCWHNPYPYSSATKISQFQCCNQSLRVSQKKPLRNDQFNVKIDWQKYHFLQYTMNCLSLSEPFMHKVPVNIQKSVFHFGNPSIKTIMMFEMFYQWINKRYVSNWHSKRDI